MTEPAPEQTADDQPGTEVAVRQSRNTAMLDKNTDSWFEMARPIFFLAEQIANTQFVPKGMQGNAPGVAAAILHGRELGLPPMTSLAQTHVIEGRPSISAEGQRGLVLAAGHDLEVLETTGAICRMRGRRKGSQTWTEVTWTVDMARAANLLGKTNWRGYPRSMLQARCSAELCRLMFPDVLHGLGAVEELEDLAGETGAAYAGQSSSTVERAPRKTAAAAPPRKRPELPSRPPADPAPPETAGGEDGGQPADDTAAEPGEAAPPPAAAQPPPVGNVHRRPSPPVSAAQLRMLGVTWNKLGVTDDMERRTLTGLIVGRDLDGTTKNMTVAEATGLIDRLAKLDDRDGLEEFLRTIDEANSESGQ